MDHRRASLAGVGGAGEEAGEAVEMTKERRDELRAYLKENFTELIGDWVTYIGDDDEPGFAVDVNELHTLLDSDERLEQVTNTADEMFAEHRSRAAFVPAAAASSDRFEELLKLQPNWDSYGAKAPDPATLKRAEAFLEWHTFEGDPEPSVVPLNDGGVQLEWHRNGQDLEIEFRPSGQDDASWNGSPLQAVALFPGLTKAITVSKP